jgi:TIGR03009 family protein
MTARSRFWTFVGLLAAAVPAVVVGQQRQGAPPAWQAERGPQRPTAQSPANPVRPQYSAAPSQHGAGAPRPYREASGAPYRVASGPSAAAQARPSDPVATVPFTLTPREQAQVDWLLQQWEKRGAEVETFECRFTRFEYDGVFDTGEKARFVDQGEIKYAAPDKGMFRVFQPRGAAELREEHWICDGKSVFQYDFEKRQLVEHQLPPEMQGNAISDGPLPFLFGAKAEQIKRRYFVQITNYDQERGQVELEAWPRFQAEAASFQRVKLILTLSSMQPFAMQIVSPNGDSRTSYQFQNIKVDAKNPLDPLGIFEDNWLYPRLPSGWTKFVEPAPTVQAGRPPATRIRQ